MDCRKLSPGVSKVERFLRDIDPLPVSERVAAPLMKTAIIDTDA